MKSSVKKSVVKKAPRVAAAAAPKVAKPLLNVVPLDEIKLLLLDHLTAHETAIQKRIDALVHPMVTVHKSENVGASTFPLGTTVFSPTNDIKPILLSDSHRISLESLFGGEPLSKPDDVVRFSHRLSTVKLNGPDGEAAFVTIPLDTLERLEARRPVDTTLKEMIERGFSDYLEGLINGVF